MRRIANSGLPIALGLFLVIALTACPAEDDTPVMVPVTGTTSDESKQPVTGQVDGNGKEAALPTNPPASPTPAPTPAANVSLNFIAPRNIAFDAQGNAWITCFGDGMSSGIVTAIASESRALFAIAQVGLGPDAIVSDGSGNLWVANRGGDTVSRIVPRPLGESPLVTSVTVGRGPSGLTVDDAGTIWVAIAGDRQIVSVNPVSLATASLGPTIEAGGIAYHKQHLFVSNAASDSVAVYSRAGTPIGTPVQVGSAPGPLMVSGDTVWVACSGSSTIVRIDAAFAPEVTANISLNGVPAALTLDPSGNVLASMPGLGKIAKLSPQGAWIGETAKGLAPYGLGIGKEGSLWTVDNTARTLTVGAIP